MQNRIIFVSYRIAYIPKKLNEFHQYAAKEFRSLPPHPLVPIEDIVLKRC